MSDVIVQALDWILLEEGKAGSALGTATGQFG